MPGTSVLAHRGAWGAAPENSLEAFEAAIAVGADWIEFDVRQTADRRLIAFHDPSVAGIPVGRLLHAELSVKRGSARPPLLGEVVELARGRIGIDVELKERGCAGGVLEALAGWEPEQCLVSSFHDDALADVGSRAPHLRRSLLVGRASRRAGPPPAVARMRRCGADGLGLDLALVADGWLADRDVGSTAMFVWTVNDDAALDACLADPRIWGVVTDVPAQALARRRSAGRRRSVAPS